MSWDAEISAVGAVKAAAVETGFRCEVNSAASPAPEAAFALLVGKADAMALVPPFDHSQARAVRAQREFEAFAMRTFIDGILPDTSGGMFGTGAAGRMWSSLLAEKVADSISAGGRLRLLPEEVFARALAQSAQSPGDVP